MNWAVCLLSVSSYSVPGVHPHVSVEKKPLLRYLPLTILSAFVSCRLCLVDHVMLLAPQFLAFWSHDVVHYALKSWQEAWNPAENISPWGVVIYTL